MQHAGSPNQGSNAYLLQWKRKVLTAGLAREVPSAPEFKTERILSCVDDFPPSPLSSGLLPATRGTESLHPPSLRKTEFSEAAASITTCTKPPAPESEGQVSKLLAETPLLSAPTPPLGQARGDPATCLALPTPDHPAAGPEQEVQVMDGPQWGSCLPGPLCQQPGKPVIGLVTPVTTHGTRPPPP